MGNDSTTPYAAPQSDVQTDQEKFLEILPASNWKRFFNLIIDYIGMYLVLIIIATVAAVIWGEAILLSMQNISRLQDILLTYVCYFLYYLFFESIFGKTLGKLITGTVVVNELGTKPTFKQFFARSLCRLIPFEPFSFFGSKGYGWHDSIPNTYVIDIRKQKA